MMPKSEKHKRKDNHKNYSLLDKKGLKHFSDRSMRRITKHIIYAEMDDENIINKKQYYQDSWAWD